MGWRGNLSACGELQPIGVGFRVVGDLFKDLRERDFGLPSPLGGGFGGIEDHPRDIEGPFAGVSGDGVEAEAIC
jgi:hypothetical protein